MRNQLSHTVGKRTFGLSVCTNYKITIYTVVLSSVDGEILLLPVRVAMLKSANIVAYLFCAPVRRITFKAIIFSTLD